MPVSNQDVSKFNIIEQQKCYFVWDNGLTFISFEELLSLAPMLWLLSFHFNMFDMFYFTKNILKNKYPIPNFPVAYGTFVWNLYIFCS